MQNFTASDLTSAEAEDFAQYDVNGRMDYLTLRREGRSHERALEEMRAAYLAQHHYHPADRARARAWGYLVRV